MPFSRAPADIARSSAESEAPWVFNRLTLGRHYLQSTSVNTLIQAPSSFSGSIGIGESGRGLTTGGESVTDVVEAQSVVTIVAVVTLATTPTGNYGIMSSMTSSNVGWAFLADNEDFDTGNTDTFAYRSSVTGSQPSLTTGAGTATPGLHTVVVRHDNRFGFDAEDLWLDGRLAGTQNSAGTPNDSGAAAYIGTSANGSFTDTADFSGQIHYVLVFRHRWSDAEIQALSRDPFGPFRRRRTFVPVTVGGADITGSGSPQAGDATATGTGERVITGSTTVQAQNATATGTGERVITDQSSTVQARPATASGSGTVGDAITGLGSAQAQDATATATGEREITASGSPQAQNATATGVGERIITGTAAVQADPANASGTDTEEAFKAKLQPGVNYARFYSYIKG